MSKKINFKSIQIDGVDTRDYPDFVDTYATYAEYEDGTELSEQELETLTEENPETIQELAHESFR